MQRQEGRRGFSLIEVLIALVIAAGIISVTTVSLGQSALLDRRATALDDAVESAATIAARLRAGLTDVDALLGFSGWTIRRAPIRLPNTPDYGEPAFERVRLEGPLGVALELIVRRGPAS